MLEHYTNIDNSIGELKTKEESVKTLEERLAETQTELESIRMAVSVSEANKEEEISKVRQQCQQEIQSMQALLRGKNSSSNEDICRDGLPAQVLGRIQK